MLVFLLITVALLIAFSIYCYLIKYRAKQKLLLPCQYTINKLKKNWVLKTYKIESNGKLKEINIKNCTCYYFNDIIKFEDFDLDNMLIDEKLSENILVYDVSYITFMGAKPLRIRFCR